MAEYAVGPCDISRSAVFPFAFVVCEVRTQETQSAFSNSTIYQSPWAWLISLQFISMHNSKSGTMYISSFEDRV